VVFTTASQSCCTTTTPLIFLKTTQLTFGFSMDYDKIIEWLDDKDKMLTAVQVTITLLLNQQF
jgi:hypothetical protein